MATAESLQQQVEALRTCCPVLCPSIMPSGYDTQDLLEIMQHAGREPVQAFEALLEGAGRGVDSCCVCGADGTPSTSSSSGGEEDDDESGPGSSSLFFTVLTGLDFKSRTVALTRAGFACTQCRALRSTCRMVRFASLRVGSGQSGDVSYEEHQQRLLVLAAHLAATNRAPDSLQASPEGLAVWLQELYCRAYALQVVASNLTGWRAVGPDGQPLRLTRGRDVVAAAHLLLAGPTAAGSAKKQKKQAKEGKQGKKGKEGKEELVREEQPQRVKGGGKKASTKAAAAAVEEEQEEAEEEEEEEQRQRLSKKQRKEAAAASKAGTPQAQTPGGKKRRAAVQEPAAPAGRDDDEGDEEEARPSSGSKAKGAARKAVKAERGAAGGAQQKQQHGKGPAAAAVVATVVPGKGNKPAKASGGSGGGGVKAAVVPSGSAGGSGAGRPGKKVKRAQ